MTRVLVSLSIVAAFAACGDNIEVERNQPPTAMNLAVSTAEDTAVTFDVTAIDPDGDPVEIELGSPAHGTLSGSPPSVTYTPEPDYAGADSVTVQVSDGALTTTATIAIAVTPVNDAPVAVADSFATAEDTTLAVPGAMLVANDTDVDGPALAVTAVGGAVNGTVELVEDQVVFVPAADYQGDASFEYTISDGELTATAIVTVTVGADNDPPIAVDDTATTTEDLAVTRDAYILLANDIDVEDQTLMISAVQNAVNGTVAFDGTTITFTPDPNFHGTARFEYTMTDGQHTDTATVTVTVNPVNDAPVAVADELTTSEDTPLTIPTSALVANDIDVDGNFLAVTAVHSAVNGTLSLVAGTIRFTPSANFHGTASFDYVVSDGPATSTARVTVTVTAVNDAPVTVADDATTSEDTAVAITADHLLANDSDVERNFLTVTAVQGAASGAVSLASGTVTFTPDANFNGEAWFDYVVSDGLDTSIGRVMVTVTAVNDAPIAVADIATTDEDTALVLTAGDLMANDTDIEGDVLSVTAVQNPVSGTVSLASGIVTFTPDADYSGEAWFDYELSDGRDSSTARVTVTMIPVNDAPVAQDQAVATEPDVPVAITLVATDIDSGSLTYSVVTGPASGTLSGAGATLTYTPAAGFAGSDRFTFRASDGSLDSNEAEVIVTVADLDCGNGALDVGEECDDGNRVSGDGCSVLCRIERCGDGVINNGGTEACDDGNTTPGDGCRADCRGLELCGDGWVDSAVGEQCDDGNTTPGDGCDAICLLDPFVSRAPQPVSGALVCTLQSSSIGRKAAVDQLGGFYVVMICGGEAHVSVSTDRGVTWVGPTATGITGVAEVAIEGGAAGVAYVAAVTGSGDLAFTRTTDAGATWAAPRALASGIRDAEVSLDSTGGALFMAVSVAGGLRVLSNLARGEGVFDVVDVAQASAYHDIVVDRISSDIWLGSDAPELHVTRSSDLGVSFGAESLPPGEVYYSDWAGSNGFLYSCGTGPEGTGIYVIPASDPATSALVPGLPEVDFGSFRAMDADAFGNAYVVSQLDTDEIQLDRMLVGASVVEAADARTVAAAGIYPAVAALPSNNGALVAYTAGTTVYGAVLVY